MNVGCIFASITLRNNEKGVGVKANLGPSFLPLDMPRGVEPHKVGWGPNTYPGTMAAKKT